MALTKVEADGINLADTFAFTGTVTGAGLSDTNANVSLKPAPVTVPVKAKVSARFMLSACILSIAIYAPIILYAPKKVLWLSAANVLVLPELVNVNISK